MNVEVKAATGNSTLTLVHAAQRLSAQLPLLPIFKQLLGFYSVVSVLDTLYDVDFPDEYTGWLAVFSFLGFGFDGHLADQRPITKIEHLRAYAAVLLERPGG